MANGTDDKLFWDKVEDEERELTRKNLIAGVKAFKKREYMKKYRNKRKKQIQEYGKEYSKRPEVKARIKKYYQQPEQKEKQRKYAKEYNQRPEVRKKSREWQKKYKTTSPIGTANHKVGLVMESYNLYKRRLKKRLANQHHIAKGGLSGVKRRGANTPQSTVKFNAKALDELFKDTVCEVEKPKVCELVKRRLNKKELIKSTTKKNESIGHSKK